MLLLTYGVPLSAVISLVYMGTRYENPQQILQQSARLFAQIGLVLGAIQLVLYFLTISL